MLYTEVSLKSVKLGKRNLIFTVDSRLLGRGLYKDND